MRLWAGVGIRVRCRKLRQGVTKWILADLGWKGFIGKGVERKWVW